MKEKEIERMCVCPDCGGDGKETCWNPDHGFISALSFHDIGRLGCPCCGHSEDRKVKNGGNCYTCNGNGEVNEETALKFIEDMELETEPLYLPATEAEYEKGRGEW